MTQTTFTDNVLIDGSQDITQLTVEGHSTQNEALQTWQDSADTPLAKLTGDGRLQVGDFEPAGTMATDDALIEAHRSDTSTKPKRGLHTLGRISGAVSDVLTWAVQELELLGSGGVTSLQTALRGRITHKNTGTSTTAELRAGDFEATNETGTTGARVGKAVGVRAAVRNLTGGFLQQAIGAEISVENPGTITDAYGLKIADMPSNVSGSRYALYSGTGTAHFGDDIEVPVLASTPTSNPPTNFAKLYTKLVSSEPRLFTKDASGTEREVSGRALSLLVSPTSGGADIFIDSADGTEKRISLRTASSVRWQLVSNSAAETGGSTGAGGSDFGINRYRNDGTYLGTSFFIRRSDGVVFANEGKLSVNQAPGISKAVSFLSNGGFRWQIGSSATAESGGNAGSDFYINRYSDAGAYLTTPLLIRRSDGQIMTGQPVLVGAFTGTATWMLQMAVANQAAQPGGGSWINSTSDARLKTVLGEYERGLDFIRSLPTVKRYEYNGKGDTPKGSRHVGFIAQEILPIAPEWVLTRRGKLDEDEDETEIYALSDGEITYALVNAVRDLAQQFDQLKREQVH